VTAVAAVDEDHVRARRSVRIRYCRGQTVSNEREMTCRRAVAETWRYPCWLSSTTRILSASLQCRRRGTSGAVKKTFTFS
jgi:hypothetical protein